MTTETKGSTPIFQERLSREIRYSCHPQLDEYLRYIDNNLPTLPYDGVTVYDVSRLIGFGHGKSTTQVLRILQHARNHKLIKTEPSGHPYIHKYKREHILSAAATVQIRAQGVVWDNMPYALYHYIDGIELREVVSKPHEPYDPSRKWNNSEVERRHVLFDIEDQGLLIEPGEIDLSAQTVLSDIPEDFLQRPEPIVATEEPSVQQTSPPEKESLVLSPARLRWLHVFLTYDSEIKPFQMDTISELKLQPGGFTFKEAESVFKEFSGLSGSNGDLVDDDKTYYALNNAIGEILRARRSNGNGTDASS
ncbi:MAG: hypothetical protein A3J39_02155 [Sulfuricurvum sp. RIFCSPHIGHO2_12_FULL_44_8]|nr:MAG: hypothetical protein A3J39_02155 [Sulfuricurvum sp. RIFCSPHIGHO2_12_FULL_44_8]